MRPGKRIAPAVLAALCALALSACGTDVAAPGADGDDAPTATASDASANPAPIYPMGGRIASGSTVSVADTPVPHLIDASGATLYVLEGNRDGGKCDAPCQAVWPPVLIDSPDAVAGMQGVDAAGLGAHQHGEQTQLTWRGEPLYRYAGDLGASRAAGDDIQDEWGRWSLARP